MSVRDLTIPEAWRKRAIVIRGAASADDWFSDEERAYVATLQRDKRIAEWTLSRVAAKRLALDLSLCTSPRDCTVDRTTLRVPGGLRSVSISHSADCAAAAIDVEPVGIDIERIRELSPNAAHLFLTGREEAAMRDARIAHAILHFWAAKEAAWKKRGGAIGTLKRVPLELEAETEDGLRFDEVETFASGDLVVALTRPSGAAGSSRR